MSSRHFISFGLLAATLGLCTPGCSGKSDDNTPKECTGSYLVCDPDDSAQILRADSCGVVLGVAQTCASPTMCSQPDVQQQDLTNFVDATCAEIDAPCARPGTDEICDPQNAQDIIKVNACGEQLEVLTTCGEGSVCNDVNPINPDKKISPRCIQNTCEPVFKQSCDPADARRVLSTNSCTGEATLAETCGEGALCSTASASGGTVPARCVDDGCNSSMVQVCDANNPQVIVSRDSCTGETMALQTCEAGEFCSTRDGNTIVPARCDDMPCEPDDKLVCDPTQPRALVRRNDCTGEVIVDKTCAGDASEGCLPGRTSNSDATCGNICGNKRAGTACDPGRPTDIMWTDECGNTTTVNKLCGSDKMCRDTNDAGAAIDPVCGEKVCVPEQQLACDPNNPAVILSVNSCTGDSTVESTCQGAQEYCSTVDGSGFTQPAQCVTTACTPTFVLVCDPNNPQQILSQNSCTGATTVESTCQGAEEYCSTLDASGNAQVPQCVTTVCTPDFELVCDPSNEIAIFSENSCTGALTVDTMCTDVGEGCTPGPFSTSAPRCGNICGSSRAEKVCDPTRPDKVYWADECGNFRASSTTCRNGKVCADVDDTGASIPGECVDPPCVPTFESVCDPSNPQQILSRNSCTGATTVESTCQGAQEYCSAVDGSGNAQAPQCVTTTCTPDFELVCDPSDERTIFFQNSCTGVLTVDSTCTDVGEGCTPGPFSTSDPRCGNICGSSRAERVCDPTQPDKVFWTNECGEITTTYRTCSGNETCDTQDENGNAVSAQCVPPPCVPTFDLVCDSGNSQNIMARNSCTGALTLESMCQGAEYCSRSDGNGGLIDARCVTTVCTPDFELVCDPSDDRVIFSENSCTGALTVDTTCTDVGEGCTPGPLSSSNPRCGNICGSSRAEAVCDPARPGQVIWTDECGNMRNVKETCQGSSTCELNGQGQAQCSCELTQDYDCSYVAVTQPYSGSSVTVKDTCGNDIVVDTCDFGERCFQDASYNNNVAECTRSIQPTQSSSAHYDYGCFSMSALVINKTNLEVDCRCRTVGDGSMGAGYAEPSTMTRPGNALPNCRPVTEVKDLTWDTPAGSGPSFAAYSDVSTINDSWFGGWLDATNRKFYAVVSWTNATHRSSGTVVSYDLDTGARAVISGIYPDPRNGEILYGSGYESPNSVAQGPATQPLTGVNAMRIAPDGNLYTLGIGTTGEATSRSAEIVRVNPTTGVRTLVWQSQTDDRGVNTSPYGQCLSHAYGNSGGVDSYESVAISSRAFAVGASGEFYMTFNGPREGDGVIKVSADGLNCEFISRWGATDFRLTPQTPLVPAPANIGTGYTPQYGRGYGMMIRNGKIYIATERLALMTVDLVNGNRVAVSLDTDGFAGLGRTSIFHDPTRNLIFTAGGPSARDGAVIDEATGRREELFADTTVPGTPLMSSVYGVRRSVTSPPTTLAQGNNLGYGPLAMDPNDPDILWMVLKGGALLKFELSTFNNYIFSL